MKHILVDLNALGIDIEDISARKGAKILTDDAGTVFDSVKELIHMTYGYMNSRAFHCKDFIEMWHWHVIWGREESKKTFADEFKKFEQLSDKLIIVPGEYCVGEQQTYCQFQDTIPASMIEKIRKHTDDYAIIHID